MLLTMEAWKSSDLEMCGAHFVKVPFGNVIAMLALDPELLLKISGL